MNLFSEILPFLRINHLILVIERLFFRLKSNVCDVDTLNRLNRLVCMINPISQTKPQNLPNHSDLITDLFTFSFSLVSCWCLRSSVGDFFRDVLFGFCELIAIACSLVIRFGSCHVFLKSPHGHDFDLKIKI